MSMHSSVISRRLQRSLLTERVTYLFDLLRELVERDLKLRYKRSVLGIAWSLLNPLSQLLVFSFLFRQILPLNIPNYPLYVFMGLLPWTWFQSSLFQATGAITDSRELIRWPGFPAAILPLVTITTHWIHFLLALPILLLFMLWNGKPLTGMLVLLPLIMGIQFLFTLSLAYLVATLQVKFRDTQHILGLLLFLTFYLTPIFYDASVVPARYRFLYDLNPMVYLLAAYRDSMNGTWPNWVALLGISLLSLGLFWVGYRQFMRVRDRFVEEL